MQKLHIGKFIAVMTVCWGISILAMLGVSNYGGLLACRFLLGLFEACLSPGFLQITTRWYKQREQPFRFALWVSRALVLPILVLLLGLLTVITGVLCWFLLPNTPADVKWLDARGRAIAVERVASSQTGIK
jgi:ACS family allantoate permease-like MFS transporter